MHSLVIDASVGVKWFLPEEHTDQATELLDGRSRLLVPTHFYAEVGNVLWKRVRSGGLSREEAQTVLGKLNEFSIRPYAVRPLLPSAFEIACQTDQTVYDCLYLALAIHHRSVAVTADRKLFNALSRTPLSAYIR
jgi:predicted nucleic acid-binding protein